LGTLLRRTAMWEHHLTELMRRDSESTVSSMYYYHRFGAFICSASKEQFACTSRRYRISKLVSDPASPTTPCILYLDPQILNSRLSLAGHPLYHAPQPTGASVLHRCRHSPTFPDDTSSIPFAVSSLLSICTVRCGSQQIRLQGTHLRPIEGSPGYWSQLNLPMIERTWKSWRQPAFGENDELNFRVSS
jgi:hypothetical protein